MPLRWVFMDIAYVTEVVSDAGTASAKEVSTVLCIADMTVQGHSNAAATEDSRI
jgi:hypothetical protein